MTEQAYRTCPRCDCTSLEVEFYDNNNSSYCCACSSEYHRVLNRLKRSHPYPVDHRCDICGKSEDEIPSNFSGISKGSTKTKKRRTPWRLDHCHETGEFRGFLCNSCNTGLGKFKDDPEILLNAIAYLQGHKQKSSH